MTDEVRRRLLEELERVAYCYTSTESGRRYVNLPEEVYLKVKASLRDPDNKDALAGQPSAGMG